MSARLHLAAPEDLPRLLPLVAACHGHGGIARTETEREAAVRPLLEGSPHGAVWLIGPRRAPVGYVAVSFGWSIGAGGMEGEIDEFFIRENVRGRGMGTEVLRLLVPQLAGAGMRALHLEVSPDNAAARHLCQRLGFRPHDGAHRMTWQAGSGA